MNLSKKIWFYPVLFLLPALLLTACPKKPPKPPVPPAVAEEPAATEAIPDVSTMPAEYSPIPEISTIFFSFDGADLSSDAKAKLNSNVAFLKAHPELEIMVEGHTCECGTNEYNLALGQKRAKIVQDYYIQSGIPAVKVNTISYGEEKPVNINAGPPDSPLCGVNRRGETKARQIKLSTPIK